MSLDWSALTPEQFGWVYAPDEVERVVSEFPFPVMTPEVTSAIRDTGKGKIALPFLALQEQLGTFPIHEQEIGDCVSHGWGLGVDVLQAVMAKQGLIRWHKEAATEPIYGGSRVEIGGGRINGDGSVGAWAAKYVADYGILFRQVYGSEDLTTYSGRAAKRWGDRGVPDDLEDDAREHPVKTVSLVTAYEDVRDAIYNGYPVPVCSNQGFRQERDSEGFARPSGSWAHCMLFCGVDDESRRPGVLCMNSWGPSWISGPKRHGQPDGSFWVDAETVNRMLRARDSFVISNFAGFPRQEIDWDALWR